MRSQIPALLLILSLVGASASNLIAVEKTGAVRTCRIVFPERPKDAPKFAYLFDGKQNHRVNLPSMNFSQVVELPAGELILMLAPSEIKDSEALPTSGFPKLEIAATVENFYIILSADPENPTLPVEMRLVDGSSEKLKSGHTLWMNQTDHLIFAKLGENDIALKPGEEIVSGTPISKSGYYRAVFSFQAHATGDTLKITEQQWWHDKKSKHLGFITDSGGRLPKIYFYRDFRGVSGRHR